MPDPFHPLASSSDWEAALEASEDTTVLIFKHSSACPVSAQADAEMASLAESGALPTYKVVVQDARSVSDAIEDDLGVRHETPQAILLRNRRPLFDASHFEVTADAVRDALSQPPVSSD